MTAAGSAGYQVTCFEGCGIAGAYFSVIRDVSLCHTNQFAHKGFTLLPSLACGLGEGVTVVLGENTINTLH